MKTDNRILPEDADTFISGWYWVARAVHGTAVEKGWWDGARSAGECLALVHSEVSEALEAFRHGNPPDDKIPQFRGAEAELADTVIRIMDLAQHLGLDVAGALIAKAEYNRSRPHKHGGKEF